MASVFDKLTGTDHLGYVCVPYDKLDAAFMIGKGARVPQTCLDYGARLDPYVLSEALGRAPSSVEWSAFVYRWLRYTYPDADRFVQLDWPGATASVPLGAGAVFTLSALVAVAALRLFGGRYAR